MHLTHVTRLISDTMRASEQTNEVVLPPGLPMPPGFARFLFLESRKYVKGRPWPLLLAAAEGRARIIIQVDRKLVHGGKPVYQRKVVAIYQNQLPQHATTILADSTADREDIETLIGRPVIDITPCGRIERKKLALQIPQDVTRTTAGRTVANVVRGILAEFQPQRLGIICHSPHRAAIEALADPRIVRVVHFGQGPDRADNSWTRVCDLICVLGTPRPGPAAVRRELIRLGEMGAAAINDPEWISELWAGTTQEGQTILTSGMKYRDERWQRSFESLCRAELVQCLGRGRTILDSGIPVVVVSTEAGLNLPLKVDAKRVNSATERVLNALRELAGEKPQDSEVNSKIYILGNTSESLPVKTGAIAARCDLSPRAVNGYLRDLAALGLVVRDGNAGWMPTFPSPLSAPNGESPSCEPPQ